MTDEEQSGRPTYEDLIEEIEALEAAVDDPSVSEEFNDVIATARDAGTNPVFGRVIHGFDRSDLSEATVGALLFGIPMFVEGGTTEAGAYLLAAPLALVVNVALIVSLTIGIIYVAEIQNVRVVNTFFGFIPHRLVGILGASLVTAVVMMTLWGRIDWTNPALAAAQILVAMVPMSIGAALGDILPGS